MSDRKFGVSSGGSSLIDYYEPHIVTAQDYYPFGMLSRVALPGNDKSYAFGFNGKMNDNDVKGGLGNQQDYGMRIYDPRIGKFLSVDPLTKDYPWYTPYQFAGNKPIRYIDLDGLEEAEGIFTKIGTYGPNAVNTIGWGDVKATFWSGVDFFNRKLSPVGIAAHGIYATTFAEDLVTGEKRNQLTSFTDMGVDGLMLLSGGRFVSGFNTTTKLETQMMKNSSSVQAAEASIAKKSTTASTTKQASMATGATKSGSKGFNYGSFGSETLDDAIRTTEQQPLYTFKTKDLRITQTLETNKEMKYLRNFKSSIEANGLSYDLPFFDQMQIFQYKGVSYLLNGHNRLAVANKLGMEKITGVLIDEQYLFKRYRLTPEQVVNTSERETKIGNKIRW